MQNDLEAAYPMLDIQILGINENGHDIGNSAVTEGRDLPWLQDRDDDGNERSDVWHDSWIPTYRDVVVLDGENIQVAAYNLTTHDLGDAAKYDELRQILVETAIRDQRPWCNPDQPLDVNHDGGVDIDDANILLDVLNSEGSYQLPELAASETPTAYYDCNLDGYLAPIDLLQIVNHMNESSPAGEPESEERPSVEHMGVGPVGLEPDRPGALSAVSDAQQPKVAISSFNAQPEAASAIGAGFTTMWSRPRRAFSPAPLDSPDLFFALLGQQALSPNATSFFP